MADVTIATGLDSTVTLNDGVKMPLFGLGVYQAAAGDNGEAESAVFHALKHGYRMIDTAQIYRNEEDVGRGINKAGVKREDVFIVTKIWLGNGYDHCKRAFADSCQRLKTDYVDLYLIHSPNGSDNCGTFRAMVDLHKQGLIKSCGVSNFGVHHIEGLKAAGLPMPSVNQIELHPWQNKADIVKYCRDNRIGVMGYCPLAQGQRLKDPLVLELAQRYGKSPAQVLIRRSLQKGHITIPKSTKAARIVENAQVFDWSLSDEDMSMMNDLPQKSCTWDPTTSPWNG